MKSSKLAIAVGLALALAASLAQSKPVDHYTSNTAPDALSKKILATHYVSFEDGSENSDDVRGAIHRNFSSVIEQNMAQMPAKAMTAWLDKMSDAELRDLAQLYVNSKADTHRTGGLLQVFASRLDGKRIARLAQSFGYHEMNAAVLAVAPAKAQSFAASASVVQSGPTPGAALAHSATPMAALAAGGAAVRMGATPIDMSIYEIYLNFRTLPVGSLSAQAAIYETAQFAASRLGASAAAGWWMGGQIVGLMRTYAPDWYYGTFIYAVGNTVDYTQNLVNTSYNYFTRNQSLELGRYQGSTMSVMGVNRYERNSMRADGGDLLMEYPYEAYIENSQVCAMGREDCIPVQPW